MFKRVCITLLVACTTCQPCLKTVYSYRSFGNDDPFSIIDIVSLLRFLLAKPNSEHITERCNVT